MVDVTKFVTMLMDIVPAMQAMYNQVLTELVTTCMHPMGMFWNRARMYIECFHSCDYWPYWFTETEESICIKIEFNSQRFSLGHHGRHFFVLGHQYDRCDVM